MTDEIQTRTLPETEHSDLLDRMETYQNLCFSEGYYGSAIVLQEARAEIIRLKSCAAQSPRRDLWACTGCGSQKTIEQIKSENPEALSCCPERKLAALGTAGAVERSMTVNSIEAAYDEWYKTLTIMDKPLSKEIFGQGYIAGWNASEAAPSPDTRASEALETSNAYAKSASDKEDADLIKLVNGFARALLAKLRLARANGRYGWQETDWEHACRDSLHRHLEKGDPRDVAAFCAFMWHHGWVTAALPQPGAVEPTKGETNATE